MRTGVDSVPRPVKPPKIPVWSANPNLTISTWIADVALPVSDDLLALCPV